ncbi:MAG: polymer-forming cytoskeletal protein [Lachnospiraceae bacterium]|nr:polymer-forming cytoskeletal protein [Lachnospiraceae bacterium]
MSFFKDFKDDFSEALDELVPGGSLANEHPATVDDKVETKIDTDVDAAAELSKLDGLLEQVAKRVDEDKTESVNKPSAPAERPADYAKRTETAVKELKKESAQMDTLDKQLDTGMASTAAMSEPVFEDEPVSDENAVITRNMKITGDLESTGSIEVEGTINGNVKCNGKLTVTGTLNGNSTSSEFFADAARIQGEISSNGTVKIGVNSIVIGNITASSAVIAGAVKGDIDIQGPVVVDSSAVVAGNIVSRSVQINNGAVIEGFCSQKYSDTDVNSIFA